MRLGSEGQLDDSLMAFDHFPYDKMWLLLHSTHFTLEPEGKSRVKVEIARQTRAESISLTMITWWSRYQNAQLLSDFDFIINKSARPMVRSLFELVANCVHWYPFIVTETKGNRIKMSEMSLLFSLVQVPTLKVTHWLNRETLFLVELNPRFGLDSLEFWNNNSIQLQTQLNSSSINKLADSRYSFNSIGIGISIAIEISLLISIPFSDSVNKSAYTQMDSSLFRQLETPPTVS